MISHIYKCIFLHKGRTGGTSIEKSFGCLMEGDKKHLTQSQSREEYKEYWDTYFKFTIVRNPLDWMVSCYHHNKQVNSDFFLERFGKDITKMSYEDYIEWSKDVPNLSNSFLDNPDELDYIINFENLQKGFDIVCESIGKSKSTLEKIESSNHKPYMEYYTNQEMINYVEDKYGNIY